MQNEKKQMQQMQLIWFALLASQFMYVMIAYQMPDVQQGAPDWSNPLVLMMAIPAAICFLASIFLPPRIFAFKNKTPREDVSIFELKPAFTIFMALNEAITLFGFVLAIQMKNVLPIYPFAVVSILHQLYRVPTSRDRMLSFLMPK